MNKEIIDVAVEDIAKVQGAHVVVQMHRDNIAHLFELNKDNPSFLDSPIYKEYQKRCTEATLDFEYEKKEMFEKYISKTGIVNPIDWSLDYSTSKLTIRY